MVKRTRGTVRTMPVQSRSGIGQFAREQPLLTSVLCVAFGVLLGCLLRITPEESEFFEEQADKLRDQASKIKDGVGDLATEGYGRAKEFAERAVGAAAGAVKGVSEASSAEASSAVSDSAPKAEVQKAY